MGSPTFFVGAAKELYHVYRVTHLPSGLIYFGCSCHPERRLKEHTYRYGAPKLREALLRDGISSCALEVIASFESRKSAHSYERQMIVWNKTIWPNGFNLQKGGEGTLTANLSKESRQRLSRQQKEIHGSEEGRERLRAIQTEAWSGERGEIRRAEQQKRWADPEFRERALAGIRRQQPESLKAFWSSPAGDARRKALADQNRRRAAFRRLQRDGK